MRKISTHQPLSEFKKRHIAMVAMLIALMAAWVATQRITIPTEQALTPNENTFLPSFPVQKGVQAKTSQNKAKGDTLINSAWYGSVMKSIQKAEYKFTKIDSLGKYSSPNRKNNMRFYYDENGFSVQPRTTKILEGKPDPRKQPHEQQYKTLAEWKVEFLMDKQQVVDGRWSVQDHQAEYITDNMTVQYVNGEDGMRQNFIVKKTLACSEELKVNFTVKTKLKQEFSNNRLSFIHPREGAVLNYDGLKVWDAKGKELAAQFEKNGQGYSIHVNTLGATYPVTIDPISSSPSASIESNQANAQLGYSVDGAGDVNKDGFDDIIVGAPYYDNGEVDEGAVFMFYGSQQGISTILSAPPVESNQAGALAGYSVAGAGDVNGDGFDDVIIGLPYYDNGQVDEGVVWVFGGSATGLDLATTKYILQGDQANSQYGWAVDGAGDVDADGFDDLIVGVPNYDHTLTDQGTIAVYRGSAVDLVINKQFQISKAGAKLGWSVAGIGDFNNDGYDDVGMGAPFLDDIYEDEGFYLWAFGSATGILSTGTRFFSGRQANCQMGYAISSAGDLNGDGFDEIIVGAPFFDNGNVDEGLVAIWYGTNNFPGGYATYDGGQDNAHFGMSIASLDDINQDGYEELLIGAPDYDNGQINEGAAFLYMGSAGGLGFTYTQIFESNQSESKFGQSLAGRMDLNGDGFQDLIIGASKYDNGQADEGAVFLYYDQPSPLGGNLDIIADSDQSAAWMGYSVSGAGDLNGDGYSDVIVGAPGYANGEAGEGVVFVYYGSANGLNTTSPVMLESNQGFSVFGNAVSTAGDVNGDGYSDIIVGNANGSNEEQQEGRVFIYHGSASGIATTPSVILEPNIAFARMGASVASAGDINGDGYSDVIIGASYSDVIVGAPSTTKNGTIYIYYGSPSGIIAATPTTFESGQDGAQFGYSVAGAGDVNGDGFSDIIAGAPYYDNGETDEGIVRLYYGSASGVNPLPVTLDANLAGALFGLSVSSAGDVNGDGYSDVAVGSPKFGSGQFQEGAVYIFMGSAAGINTTAAGRMESNIPEGNLGGSISGAGDLNGDGFADVVAGATLYSKGQTYEGAAYIYMGSVAGLAGYAAKIVETNQPSSLMSCASSAGDVNGDGYSDLIFGHHGFDSPEENEGGISMLYGSADVLATRYSAKIELNQAEARLGTSVAIAGDINGDGFSDVIVGSPQYDFGQYNEGTATVYLGTANGLSGVPTTLQRNQESSGFGISVASAGDVNGDGYDDVIVGAPFYNNGEAFEGAAFLYYGSNGGIINAPVLLEKDQAFAFFGISVSAAGDVNGDGYDDLLVGATGFNNGQTGEGGVFLYLGSASGINTNSTATLEMDQAGAGFGFPVSSAGDVNGDGFADVVVGATQYDNGETDEGAAFVFHGSAAGIITTPARMLESNQTNSDFGITVARAGDVNGDGFSDILIGAPNYDDGESNEGNVFVYHGSATGIAALPNRVLQFNQAGASFGGSVASAGDVNSDGYSDVIIGAFHYTAPQLDEGAVMIYLGSPSGITADVAKLLESSKAGAQFGISVAGGGDINGDGFGDIMTGASRYSNGQTDEGMVFVHYGNAAKNFKRNNVDLYNTDLVTPVNITNFSNSQFGAGLFARSFMGRDKGKLVWETRRNGTPYTGSPISNSGAFTAQQNVYTDLGLSGIELKTVVDKLPGRLTDVRARVKYNPATAITGQLYGPWRYVETVSGSPGALPVDLISFNVAWHQQGQMAMLNFITENESEIDHYEIEKSTNGKIFTKLTEVAADNIPDLHQYSYVDSNATASRQYYRLHILHANGASEYSRIVVLSNNNAAEISMYPNPATDVVNLKMTKMTGQVNLRVINSSGQTVKRLSFQAVPGERIQVQVSDLPTGIYNFHLQNDGKAQVLKLVKP
ncbi:Por secretion system C-terminal sorting domain-containing protein [Dyadobacter soli]|uniref:Por secretion system C-terminal sorting domain-containing protein n=1 Tax=Dyadobacter soli TaxID=659014 RepID=A0A1G7Y0T8_9BACT|nr:FG-GAP-like repeat-containing protein [Dyadobacter soli]SDG90059.1 Por secretion system C-terminal sorting domain-containing protein [Dyadobacter soli]